MTASQSGSLVPQAARLLEHIRTINEQYGDGLADDEPALADALCRCATALNAFLATRADAARNG